MLDWEGAAEAGASAAGGKGWNLGRLARYGLPVPPGVVLPTDFYRQHLVAASLENEARALSEPGPDVLNSEVDAQLAALRSAIGEAALAEEIRRALAELLERPDLAGQPLAVRSSASAEDGAVASFAGMHSSTLNVPPTVEALEAAVKRCYASLWTPHAVAYRAQRSNQGPVEQMLAAASRRSFAWSAA